MIASSNFTQCCNETDCAYAHEYTNTTYTDLREQITKLEDYQNRRYLQIIRELENLYKICDSLKNQNLELLEKNKKIECNESEILSSSLCDCSDL